MYRQKNYNRAAGDVRCTAIPRNRPSEGRRGNSLGALRLGRAGAASRLAKLIKNNNVVARQAGAVAHRAHAAPLPVDRAVLAPAPGRAGPVAVAPHGGVDLVVELRR